MKKVVKKPVKKYQNGGINDDKSRGEQRLDNRINRNKYKLAQAQKELNTTAPDPKNLYSATPGKYDMLENYIEKKTKRVQKLEDKKARKYPTKTYVVKTGGSVKRKK